VSTIVATVVHHTRRSRALTVVEMHKLVCFEYRMMIGDVSVFFHLFVDAHWLFCEAASCRLSFRIRYFRYIDLMTSKQHTVVLLLLYVYSTILRSSLPILFDIVLLKSYLHTITLFLHFVHSTITFPSLPSFTILCYWIQ
jgi:hypothetical protein